LPALLVCLPLGPDDKSRRAELGMLGSQ